MKQMLVWALILGSLAILGLDGYFDAPVEKANVAFWIDSHMASAGTHGNVLRGWLEERGYSIRDVDEYYVQTQIGFSKLNGVRAQRYWAASLVKKRPLGEMNMVVYVAENDRGNYLQHWSTTSVQGWP